jgi:hypothetical protein
MRISPSVMSSNPATIRSAVDLPEPDGPTRTMKLPSAMSNDKIVHRRRCARVDPGDVVQFDARHLGTSHQ